MIMGGGRGDNQGATGDQGAGGQFFEWAHVPCYLINGHFNGSRRQDHSVPACGAVEHRRRMSNLRHQRESRRFLVRGSGRRG